MELCSAIGASPILLGRAFREFLNIEPKRYLQLYGFIVFEGSFWHRIPLRHLSKFVARNWGFWSRLQFDAEYRRLFGELPSQTLLGSPDAQGENSRSQEFRFKKSGHAKRRHGYLAD